MTKPQRKTLDELEEQAVVISNQISKIRAAEREAKNAQLAGKCFVHRTRYGQTTFRRFTGVDRHGYALGLEVVSDFRNQGVRIRELRSYTPKSLGRTTTREQLCRRARTRSR